MSTRFLRILLFLKLKFWQEVLRPNFSHQNASISIFQHEKNIITSIKAKILSELEYLNRSRNKTKNEKFLISQCTISKKLFFFFSKFQNMYIYRKESNLEQEEVAQNYYILC